MFPYIRFFTFVFSFQKISYANLVYFLSLNFFSNVYNYPFHEFVFSINSFFDLRASQDLIKYSTFSTILSLICINLILSPKFIYISNNYLLLTSICILVFFNAMDALAVSIVYCFNAFLRLIKQQMFFKETLMILLLTTAWLINFYFGTINHEVTTDAKNILNYSGLYFLLPICITTLSFFAFNIDSYQFIRRFSVLVVVMASEIIILSVHQLGILKFSIMELQFLSIYNIFHVLYYIPFIFWLCNSRNLIMINRSITFFSPHRFITIYLPLAGIVLAMMFNLKLVFIASDLL